MALESSIQTLLLTLCDRVFTDFAPMSTTRPYITWQQIGGQAVTFYENAVPSKENALIQVNVWASTRSEATSLSKQIEEAFTEATTFQSRPVSARVNDADPDLKIYSNRQDFTCWADR